MVESLKSLSSDVLEVDALEDGLDGIIGKEVDLRKSLKFSSNFSRKNDLTDIIPGYFAPMHLDSTKLDDQQRYPLTDKITHIAATSREYATQTMKAKEMMKPSMCPMPSFKMGTKRPLDKTAGSGWFNMEPAKMTEELKMDLEMLKMRNYIDPKRFYKSHDKIDGKIVQLGTVIEGAAEYHSSRLTKKQRRMNFTEEIMADRDTAKYAKKKNTEIEQSKQRPATKRKSRKRR